MAISTEQKQEIIKGSRKSPNDTGSTAVQVALLSARINDLQSHFEKNAKDHHSRRGLLRLVGQRRRLLDYLKENDVNEYRSLIDTLGIRK